MADTLIDVINEVLTATSQRGNKTAIAQTDSTAFIRDRLNDALENIYDIKPFVVDLDGTTTITASTRTFSGPSGIDLNNIDTDTFRINDANGDIPLPYVTEDFIIQNYPSFETAEADLPMYVYFTNGLLAIYPLLTTGATSLTLQYKYSSQFVKLTATTATFPFKDRSPEMKYCKLWAQRDYEISKGLGQPGATQSLIDDEWAKITGKYRRNRRFGFSGARIYGR
jgi:hypothetical protein